jgi:glycosyltransferase involved in cell wall biosynthesis
VLIDAFARLGPSAAGCELWIAGRGSRRASLEQRARDSGVGDRVRFLGEVGHAAGLMRGARVFALPSRFEGFPNALLEAMSSGAPCVATDCPSGPRELLGDDEGGILVPVDDVDRLAEAIDRVLADRELAGRLSVAGRRIAESYSLDAIAERWEHVFSEAACRR